MFLVPVSVAVIKEDDETVEEEEENEEGIENKII